MVCMSLLMAACDDNERAKDLRQYVNEIKQKASNKQQSKPLPPSINTIPVVNYTADSYRTPFGETTSGAGKTSTPTNNSNPLLSYTLDALKLVGTVSQGQTITAYILAPDNKVYSVKQGDKIGSSEGVVTNIQSERLDVIEQEAGSIGGEKQRIVTLELRKSSNAGT